MNDDDPEIADIDGWFFCSCKMRAGLSVWLATTPSLALFRKKLVLAVELDVYWRGYVLASSDTL